MCGTVKLKEAEGAVRVTARVDSRYDFLPHVAAFGVRNRVFQLGLERDVRFT